METFEIVIIWKKNLANIDNGNDAYNHQLTIVVEL